jgi:hypothetical protein
MERERRAAFLIGAILAAAVPCAGGPEHLGLGAGAARNRADERSPFNVDGEKTAAFWGVARWRLRGPLLMGIDAGYLRRELTNIGGRNAFSRDIAEVFVSPGLAVEIGRNGVYPSLRVGPSIGRIVSDTEGIARPDDRWDVGLGATFAIRLAVGRAGLVMGASRTWCASAFRGTDHSGRRYSARPVLDRLHAELLIEP